MRGFLAVPPAPYRGAARFYSVTRMLMLLIIPGILLGRAIPDVLVSMVGAAFVIHTVLSRDRAFLRVRWVQAALLLWVYFCLRNLMIFPWTLQSLHPMPWIRFPACAVAMAFWLARDNQTQRHMVYAVSATVFFVLADTLLQYAYGKDLFGYPPFVIGDVTRLTGPFLRPRVGVTLVWLCLPVVMFLVQSIHGKPWHYWLGALSMIILTMVDVYLAGERMALLLLGLGFVLSALIYKPARKPLLAAVTIGMVCCVILSSLNPVLANRQLTSTRQMIGEFRQSPYGQPWIAAIRIGMDHPLMGVGFGQFQTACQSAVPDAQRAELRCPLHPHNIYFEWLAGSGLIGLLLFFLLVGCWAHDAWRARAWWCQHALATGLVVTFVVRLWPLSAGPSQFTSWSAIPFWFYIGWFYCMFNTQRSALDAPPRLV